ncbi:MAG: hypothetical protein H7234_00740 [Herminiimonas sp.]|nr:hypothetical protein [Herminiimonas sp.]
MSAAADIGKPADAVKGVPMADAVQRGFFEDVTEIPLLFGRPGVAAACCLRARSDTWKSACSLTLDPTAEAVETIQGRPHGECMARFRASFY